MAKSKKVQETDLNEKEQISDKLAMDSQLIDKAPTIQSFGLTKMRYDFTVGEKNIFLKIIEKCNDFIDEGCLGKKNDIELVTGAFGTKVPMIEISIKDLLQDKSNNYDYYRKSLETLGNKYFGVPESEGWDFKKMVLFDNLEGSESKGKLRVTMSSSFWKTFYDLRAFKLIDTDVEYKLNLVSSKRMYELLVGNRNMMTFSIDHLKLMFCAEEKYKNTNMFITRVIKPAQKELRESDFCPFYFDYETVTEGRKIAKINFIVIDKAMKAESTERMNALRKDAEGVTLSQAVTTEVDKCFPSLVIREDVELKLKRLQKQIGPDELCAKIRKIKQKTDKLNEENALKGTVSAYFIGSLDKMFEDIKIQANNSRIYRSKIDEAQVVENTADEYFTIDQLKKKAKLAGMNVEDFINQFNFEMIDEQTYRMKG